MHTIVWRESSNILMMPRAMTHHLRLGVNCVLALRLLQILPIYSRDSNQVCSGGYCHMSWAKSLTAREAIEDPIHEIHAELSHRRTAYHVIPTRGLAFASEPTTNMLPGGASLQSLALSPDAPINRALIEYEDWLTNTMSTLRGSLGKRQQSHKVTKLIEEINLATEEVHAAKCYERSRQLAEAQISRPLPPFVIDSQCAIVDGG